MSMKFKKWEWDQQMLKGKQEDLINSKAERHDLGAVIRQKNKVQASWETHQRSPVNPGSEPRAIRRRLIG